MGRCPICGSRGGYQGFIEFECISPGCQNYVWSDGSTEAIGPADESEFDCAKTEPIVLVPSSGWVDMGGI
jgi:hypothetical protein